jgi:FKBP-type peptidyl-prolyl cis-trans isomerase
MKLTFKLIAAFLCAVILAACGAAANPNPVPPPVIDPTTQPPGFAVTDTTVGSGTVAAAGDTVTVTYTGWIYSTTAANHEGAQFDSNVGKAPMTFTLGAGLVIPGWDQGIVGMAVGGARTLTIPYSLGYGLTPRYQVDANGQVVLDASGNKVILIPAYSGLIFNVQLLAVTKAK